MPGHSCAARLAGSSRDGRGEGRQRNVVPATRPRPDLLNRARIFLEHRMLILDTALRGGTVVLLLALALACNGIGAWYAIAGRAADLVESRRRLRSLLIVLVAVYSVVTLVPVVAWPAALWPQLALANAAGLLAITLAFAVALLAVNP